MPYPDFLSPLADSYRDVQEFTTPAIAYSYDLFIETQLKEKKLVRNRRLNTVELKPNYFPGSTKEEQLLRFILEDQISIPYSLYDNPVPGTKFTARFLEEIQNLWTLTTPKGQLSVPLSSLTSTNNPISLNPPKIMGEQKAPAWLYYFLAAINEDDSLKYTNTKVTTSAGEEIVKAPSYKGLYSPTLDKAVRENKISEDDLEEFQQDLVSGKWSLYIEHYPLVSKRFFKELPKAGLSTVGVGFISAATAGNLFAYSITPELGALVSAFSGGVLLLTGVSSAVWNSDNKNKGIIRLTPAGQRLLKEYTAWHKYLNRKNSAE